MCGKNPHIDSYMYRKLSHGERAKINGGPQSPLGYMRQCAFMIKFHNLQNYFLYYFSLLFMYSVPTTNMQNFILNR